jgi:hypothetical protein
MSWSRLACVVLGLGVFFGACANGLLVNGQDGGAADGTTGDVITSGDASGCPQFNLMTDPQHCGSCTNACPSGEVCSSGMCKMSCQPPTTKCLNDDAGACFDLSSSPTHCGTCTTVCDNGDASALAPGNGNPDSGVNFGDAGYDGGTGWTQGTATCTNKTCGVTCPPGTTECADSICYDLGNYHDHCGSCTTACQASVEWCTFGKCCPVGQANCSGTCTDISSDANNCGACGNKCPTSAPQCSGGTCTAGVTYTDSFTNNVTATTQCTDWKAFQAALTGSYTSITISGSNDTTGKTCTGTTANTLCQAIHSSGTVTGTLCNGNTWAVGTCGSGTEVTATTSVCSCTANGYYVRPCIGTNANWGSVNATTTCFYPPSQTLTVVCK